LAQTGPDARAAGDDAVLRPLGDGPGKVVLVTSARPGEGKSSVAANLAAASAMAGRRVVLIDGDLRKPQVHSLFRLPNDVGLSSMLTGELKGFAAVQRLEVTKHLVVVSGGPPPADPAELLANPRLSAALASMSSQSDLVVVDAPPLLAVTDPALIAQHCDATIMVAISGDSDRREWVDALQRLSVVGVNVIGTVLMQPDDRANATTSYRYAPSAEPKEWLPTETTTADAAPSAPAPEAAVDSTVAIDVTEADPAASDVPEQQPAFAAAEPAYAPEPVDGPGQFADGVEPVDAADHADVAETMDVAETIDVAETVDRSESVTQSADGAESPESAPSEASESAAFETSEPAAFKTSEPAAFKTSEPAAFDDAGGSADSAKTGDDDSMDDMWSSHRGH
jgi:capsular exopolysaccharide synthesis family protein